MPDAAEARPSVLLADARSADLFPASVIRKAAAAMGLALRQTASLAASIAAAAGERPHVALVHVELEASAPRTTSAGPGLASELLRRDPVLQVILYSGNPGAGAEDQVSRAGLSDHFVHDVLLADHATSLLPALIEARESTVLWQAVRAGLQGARSPPSKQSRWRLDPFLEEVERALIVAILHESGGSTDAAAVTLSLARSTLADRMHALSIEPSGQPRSDLGSRSSLLIIACEDAARTLVARCVDSGHRNATWIEPGRVPARLLRSSEIDGVIVDVAEASAVVDAWSIGRSNPDMPLLSCGHPAEAVSLLLAALAVPYLAGTDISPGLPSMVRAGKAARIRRTCLRSCQIASLGGNVGDPLDLRPLIRSLQHSLIELSVQHLGSIRAAAAALSVPEATLRWRLHHGSR